MSEVQVEGTFIVYSNVSLRFREREILLCKMICDIELRELLLCIMLCVVGVC